LRPGEPSVLIVDMDRLSPTQIAEPELPASSGSSSLRVTIYAALALTLAAGGWVRFNNQIATVAPGLAAPAAGVAQQAAQAPNLDSLLELGLVSRASEPAAVASLGLPPSDTTAMLDAVKRDRLRLVQMPLFDAGMSAPDGSDAGRTVMVSSGGYSRLVRIGRQPVVVTLPIDRVGTVSFRIPAREAGALPASGLGIGAVTATGPVRFPDLAQGQELDVGVVAQ
jgi:hypothetical protein